MRLEAIGQIFPAGIAVQHLKNYLDASEVRLPDGHVDGCEDRTERDRQLIAIMRPGVRIGDPSWIPL